MRFLLQIFLLILSICPSRAADASGPWLGQREPGTQPEIFAPGLVSLPGRREANCSFSPDGSMFYFTLVAPDGSFATQEMIRRDDGWTAPTRASFADQGNTGDAFVAPSGDKLYFGSTRPPGTPPWNGRVWVANREAGGWGQPRLLDLGIDTDKGIGFPTVSRRGTLYVGSYAEKTSLCNLGKSDIYFVDTNAAKLTPQNPGAPINSPHEEWDPFIAPDESYLLFESDRPGGVGGIDIWVSFRATGGKWAEPINLGAEVNSPGTDVAAKVSPDGRFLFFERPTRDEQDIYWVSAEVITRLKPAAGVPPLVVTRASLWTPQGVLADREILIRAGRVAAVGESGRLERPAGARIVDAAGDTLLPGLIDAHVHLVLGTRTPKDFSADSVSAATSRQLLRSGVTTGRIHLWDLPSAARLKQASAGDTFPSPRFVVGGPGFFGGQPTWESPTGNVWGVKSDADAVAKIRQLKAAGVDWIALHELGRFQPGEAEALVGEARRLGLGLMAGGDRFSEIERALELGVDSLEYFDRSNTPLYPEPLLHRLQNAGAGLFLVPCVGFPHRFVAYRKGAMPMDDARLTEFLPTETAAFVGSALREDQTKAIPHAPNWTEVPATLAGKFRQLRAAGLSVAIGTDCGSPAHFQSDSLWWEMETWRNLGVPPHDIVQAATELPARLLRQADIGHLGVGARGDFVLYRGNFADGPFSVERVRTVAKGGTLFVNDGLWVGPGPKQSVAPAEDGEKLILQRE